MHKRLLWVAAQYILGLGLLAWVVANYWRLEAHGQEVGLAAALKRPVNVAPLFLAGLFCTCSMLLTFVRWYYLVRAQNLPFTVHDAFRLGLIGFYFNTFLPGSVGGDLIKAAFIVREQSRRTVAVATVIIDRIVGLCALFWVAAILGSIFWLTGGMAAEALDKSGAASPENLALMQTLLGIVWALALASLAFWVLLGLVPETAAQRWAERLEKVPKIGYSLAEAWRALRLYRHRQGSVGLSLALAMIGHVGFVVTFYFSALALTPAGRIPSLAAHFLLVPAGMTFQAGVPTPAGVGGGELGFGALFELVGAVFAFGVLGSLVQRVWMWLLALVGYLVYLRLRKTMPKPSEGNGEMNQASPGGVSP